MTRRSLFAPPGVPGAPRRGALFARHRAERGEWQLGRYRQGRLGRRAGRRDRRGDKSGAHRKNSRRHHRRAGRVQDRRPSTRPVCRHVRPAWLRHAPARGHRGDHGIHRHRQRDDGRGRHGRHDHRVGGRPAGGHAERHPAAGAHRGDSRGAAAAEQLRRLRHDHPGRVAAGHQSGRRRQHGREPAAVHRARHPRQRLPATARRPVLRHAGRRRQLHVERQPDGHRGGQHPHRRRPGGRERERRRPDQRRGPRRRQRLPWSVPGHLRHQGPAGQQPRRRAAGPRRHDVAVHQDELRAGGRRRRSDQARRGCGSSPAPVAGSASRISPGNYFNKTQGTLFYTPDLDRPAWEDNFYNEVSARLTWRAAPRHTITGAFSNEYNCNCYFGIQTGTLAPEATGDDLYEPNWRTQVAWTFPATSKLLLEAGGTVVEGLVVRRLTGGTYDDISVLDIARNYRYGSAGGPITALPGGVGAQSQRVRSVQHAVRGVVRHRLARLQEAGFSTASGTTNSSSRSTTT